MKSGPATSLNRKWFAMMRLNGFLFLFLTLSLSGYSQVTFPIINWDSLPTNDRPHGILRIEITDGIDSCTIITRDIETGEQTTIADLPEYFDYRSRRAWGRHKFPRRWAPFPYHSAPIFKRHAQVIMNKDGEQMIVDLVNDTSFMDHNLSIPFTPGHFEFNLPELKAVYYFKQSIPSVLRLGLKTRIKFVEESSFFTSRFLAIEDISPARVWKFREHTACLGLTPFSTRNLAWARFYRSWLLEPIPYDHSIGDTIGQDSPWCVKWLYVRPVRLLSQADEASIICSQEQNFRVMRTSLDHWLHCDSTFYGIEAWANEELLHPKPRCNTNFYTTRQLNFPFVTDSIVSWEIAEEVRVLPTEEANEMNRYRKELVTRQEQNRKVREKFEVKKKVRIKEPQTVRLPQDPDGVVQPIGQRFTHLGEVWVPAAKDGKCYSPAKESVLYSNNFRSRVANPYTLKEWTLEELFGMDIRTTIHSYLLAVRADHPDHQFQLELYQPNRNFSIMWGLDPEHLLIYYGAEYEEHRTYRLEIPLKAILP